jgi:hypothetical protein
MMRVLTTSKGVETAAEMRPETRDPMTCDVSPSLTPVSFSTTAFVWSYEAMPQPLITAARWTDGARPR